LEIIREQNYEFGKASWPRERTPRILIIAEKEDVRLKLEKNLQGLGYELVVTPDLLSASHLFATSPSVMIPDLDLILVDMGTLDSQKAKLVEEIRQNILPQHYIPIIGVAESEDPKLRLKVLRQGVDEILLGPIDIEELYFRTHRLVQFVQQKRFLIEQQQQLLNRNRELTDLQQFRDDMIGLAVHDLKNPLTVITTNLSYVIEQWKDSEQIDFLEALLDARTGSLHLLRLISTLLDITRLEMGALTLDKEPVSAEGFLMSIRKEFLRQAMDKKVSISLEVHTSVQVNFDPQLMRRVVENLLTNSIRYAIPNTVILIEARESAQETTWAVRNKGPGIPQESRSLLFNKFGKLGTRGSNHGVNLGLGLYFCRLAVEAHGGTIEIEETEQWPVSFLFHLPKK